MTTLNALDKHVAIDLTDGDLTATRSAIGSPSWRSVRSTDQRSIGRYYFEVGLVEETGNGIIFGLANAGASLGNYVGVDSNGASFQADIGTALSTWVDGSYGGSYLSGIGVPDVVGVYVDLDTNVMMARDVTGGGVWGARKTISANLFGTTAVYLAASVYQTGNALTFNFGATPFLGAIPTVQQSWDLEQTGLYIPGWDPMHKHDTITLSSGNMVATSSGAATTRSVRSMEGLRNGPGGENPKVYFEIRLQSVGVDTYSGLCKSSVGTSDSLKTHADAWAVSRSNGGTWHLNVNTVVQASSNDAWTGIAWDRDTGGLWLKNDVLGGWASGDPATGASPTFVLTGTDVFYPAATITGNGDIATLKLDGFIGGIPAGYVGLGEAITDEPPDEILNPPTPGGGGLPISEELAAYLGLPPKPHPPNVMLTADGLPTKQFHDYLTLQYEWERRLHVVLTEG